MTNTTEAFRGGNRPAVIISNNAGNTFSSVVEIVYLTTQEKTQLPTHVEIESSRLPSVVLCEQIHTVCKERIENYVGKCTKEEMERIDAALAISIGIIRNDPVDAIQQIEAQKQFAELKAERDVYKELYEEAVRRKILGGETHE